MQKSEAKKGKGKGEQNAILKAELKKEQDEADAKRAWHARQHKLQTEKRVGPFSFVIEPFLEVEVLDRNQVFDDLIALEEILYNTSEPNQVAKSTTKGKRR